jgi:hypothetical protein
MRASDIFIVSYPRSGVTWLRTVIANAIKTEEMTLKLLKDNPYIPDVNSEWFQKKSLEGYDALSAPRIFTVHAQYQSVFSKVIYIVRDVRDVLVSYYHWNKSVRSDFDMSMNDFVLIDNHWPCRWDDHVIGWLSKNKEIPIITIKYEDCLTDIFREVANVFEFFDIPYEKDRLMRAVNLCTFNSMKKMDEQINAEKGEMYRFARKGKVGGWKDELDDYVAKELFTKYQQGLSIAGYDE